VIASEDNWAGRPFVDRIEIGLGVSPQQQVRIWELGKADVIELMPSLARRASQVTACEFRAFVAFGIVGAADHSTRIGVIQSPIYAGASLAIDRTAM